MDTFTRLEKLWKPKHFEHLLYCLKYCEAYFQDAFEYQERKGNGILIDGKVYSQHEIVQILSEYYLDSTNGYQTLFGDVLYLFFTDLVEDDVDILSELDDEVA